MSHSINPPGVDLSQFLTENNDICYMGSPVLQMLIHAGYPDRTIKSFYFFGYHTWIDTLSLDTIFVLSWSISTQFSTFPIDCLFFFLYLSLYVLSCSQHNTRNTIWLVMIHQSVYSQHRLSDHPKIYLLSCLSKQSFSSTRSCAGTVLAAVLLSMGGPLKRGPLTWARRRSEFPGSLEGVASQEGQLQLTSLQHHFWIERMELLDSEGKTQGNTVDWRGNLK